MIMKKVWRRFLSPSRRQTTYRLAWGPQFLLLMCLFFAHRRRWHLASLWLLAFVGLSAAGSPVLGGEWVATLEDDHWDDPFMESPMDLVIVLGGATRTAPWRRYYLGPSGDRVFLGMRLYRAGIALP